jgi:hypothetical protein
MAPHVAESDPAIPPMPERTPLALREAIAEYTPELLPDFEKHWRRAIGDACDIAPVPAFLARWWCEYAIARDPQLDAHVIELQHRAAEATDIAEAKALLDEVAKIRYSMRKLEPGE